MSAEVPEAIQVLIEETDRALQTVLEQIRAATHAGDVDAITGLASTASQIKGFDKAVRSLAARWAEIAYAEVSHVASTEEDERSLAASGADRPADRNYYGRIPRGVRTQEDEFRLPILRALVAAGGAASIGDVLDAVGVEMADRFSDVDFEPLKSDADQIRWRNSAQWTRNTLVKEGLMLPCTRRGWWEISEEGRRLVART